MAAEVATGRTARAQVADTDGEARMHWDEMASYYLIMLGIYVLVGVLFFYGGKSKIIDGHGAPQGIKTQFANTFIDTFPGIDAAWWILGILESVIFLLMVASIVTLEFLPHKRKSFLIVGLALAILTFSFLAMGQNAVGAHSSVAELYLYTGATAALLLVVLLLPPRRSAAFISG
jgi:hypothetical protein